MFDDGIPRLNFADVAQFERESIEIKSGMMELTFPANESDLPDDSTVLVSIVRPVCDGDAVAVATRDGRCMTGYFYQNGNRAMIVSLSRRVRLQWRVDDTENAPHWIFPVLSVKMICIKKSPCGKGQGECCKY